MRLRCCSCRRLSWNIISRGWAVCQSCYERRLATDYTVEFADWFVDNYADSNTGEKP